jgi:hypothetical protein
VHSRARTRARTGGESVNEDRLLREERKEKLDTGRGRRPLYIEKQDLDD